VAAGDSVEDVFNALARKGFQYAGSAQRYGRTEFIFVRADRGRGRVVMMAASTMFCGMRSGGRVGFRNRAQARHEAVARPGEAGK
jgi:hypothetical protein